MFAAECKRSTVRYMEAFQYVDHGFIWKIEESVFFGIKDLSVISDFRLRLI